MEKEIKKKIQDICKKSRVLFNEPMSKHTTLRVGGPADVFVYCEDIEELKNLARLLRKHRIQLFVIGNGSNLLVGDKGVRGVVIKLGKNFSNIAFNKKTVIAGGALPLVQLINKTKEKNMSGMEYLSGIPGSVGGAVVANAGAWGSAIGRFVTSVTIMTNKLKIIKLKKNMLKFSYRESSLKNLKEKPVILEVEFGNLNRQNKALIKKKIDILLAKRKKMQPLGKPSPGCIFKNPRQAPAGMLLDFAGLKNTKISGARISQLHANFLVNEKKAKAKNILLLIRLAQEKIKKIFGIKLELEIEKLGEF